MSASQALDAQLSMMEWLVDNDYGGKWERWFLSTVPGKRKVGAFHDLADPKLRYQVANTLAYAATVCVSRDMCAVIQKAAAELPDIPLQLDNLFWERAFVYFEQEIVQEFATAPDSDPDRVQAIQWAKDKVAPAVLKDQFMAARSEIPEGDMLDGLIHLTYVRPEKYGATWETLRTHLFPFDLSGWAVGTRWQTVPVGEAEGATKVDEGLAHQRKLLLATNLIASQYVAVVSGQPASRSTRRRAQRLDMPIPGEIKVITLRRAHQKSQPGESDPDFEYSHRFPVRGHWKHQWYPKKGEHSLIWIDPYIKGPENKPLIIKDQVWQLAR